MTNTNEMDYENADMWLSELLDDMGPAEVETFGPFKGKGSLKLAQEAAGDGCHVVTVGHSEFYSFSTIGARAAFVDENRGRMLLERVDGSRSYNPVLDVDGNETLTDNGVEEIRAAFTAAAMSLGVPAESAEPVAVRSDRPGKVSVHFIGMGWQVRNGPAGRALAKDIRARVPEPLRQFLDVQASGCKETATFSMRLPYVPKTDKAGKLIEGSTLLPEDFDPANSAPSAWVLQGFPDAGEVFGAEPPQAAPPLEPIAATDLEAFAVEIEKDFPEFERDARNSVAFNRIASSYCASCDRTHDNDGASIRIAAGTLWLNCRREQLGAAPLATHPVGGQPAELSPAPAPDAFDIIDEPAEHANEQYNTDAFDLDAMGARDNYVKSFWGTGKTRMASELIKRLDADTKAQHRRPARVLFISSRKSLSTGIATDLGLTDYRQITGIYDDAAIRLHPRTVFQLESLKRIPSDVKPFDLVIVDEPAALFAHTYAGSHSARLGLTSATGLIKRAGRLYVSDNDLSTEMIRAFRQLRKGMPSRVLVNGFKSWEGTTVDILTGLPSAIETRRRLFKFADDQRTQRDAGAEWSGAVVPCHSKKVADSIYVEAVERYGADLVRLYTGFTKDADKARDFKSPTESWEGVALVIYTTTVSVGVSCASAHISDCFAFFMGMVDGRLIAGSQASAQMLFRCRKLKRVTVSYVGQAMRGLPTTVADLMPWVTVASRRHNIPDGFRSDRNLMIEEPTEKDPAALHLAISSKFEGIAWTSNILERHRSACWFVARLKEATEAAGCVTTVTKLTTMAKAADALRVPLAALQQTKALATHMTTIATAAGNRMAADNMATALDDYREAEERGVNLSDIKTQLTEEEHHGRHAMYAARTYQAGGTFDASEPLKLDTENRAAWVHHHANPGVRQAYSNLTTIVRDLDKFRGIDQAGGVQTATTSVREASRVVRQVFEVLESTPTLLEGAACVLDLKTLAEPSAAVSCTLRQINHHARRLFGDTNAKRRTKESAVTKATAKSTANTLNVALRYVGATLVPKYNTRQEKKQGKPSAYVVLWSWESNASGKGLEPMPAPEPRPKHPIPGE
jgi:hypothetical protein